MNVTDSLAASSGITRRRGSWPASCSLRHLYLLVIRASVYSWNVWLMEGRIVWTSSLIEVEMGNGTERHSDAVCRSSARYSRRRLLAQLRDAVRAHARIWRCSAITAQTQPPYLLPLALQSSTRPLSSQLGTNLEPAVACTVPYCTLGTVPEVHCFRLYLSVPQVL